MKKTPNQIREELRRQMAKQHNDEIENLKKIKCDYWDRYAKADQECQRLRNQISELEEKVKQLEDWNNRLMEFMDMNDEERKAAIQEYTENAELNELTNGLYNRILKTFSPYFF